MSKNAALAVSEFQVRGPDRLNVVPHRFTTVELLLSVGTHLRVLDDGVNVVIFFIFTNFKLILK